MATQPVVTETQPQIPLVSVLIVSWNCIENLRRCLGALEASTHRAHMEILVVDLGSRDGCAQVDTEYPHVTILRLPRNFGKTRARNIGVRTAKGEYLLLLDPEVEVAPGAVAALAERLHADEECTAVSARLTDPAGAPVLASYRLPDKDELATACRTGANLPAVPDNSEHADGVRDYCLMVRRMFVAGMHYFEEKSFSQFWADLEMCYQIRHAGKKIATVTEATGTLHPALTTVTLDSAAETLLQADRINGAANYIDKHAGFVAGLSFRLGFVLNNLFNLRLLPAILSGERVDGTQGGVLG